MNHRRHHGMAAAASLFLLIAPTSIRAASPPPSPESFLGFPVGADRRLADYDQITGYFRALSAASERVRLEEIGRTTLGRPLWMAVISSPGNLAAADRHREIARKLADPRGLTPGEIDRLTAEGRVIILVTCNIHSTEIASSQMAMELAYELSTAQDPVWSAILDDVILLLVPSLNPDGQQMVVDWYRRWRGTEYEGGRMPWLYHHHAGHDNNRDWFMLQLPETRAVNRVLYHEWRPQVYLDEHQMRSNGPRMFVPPFQDPIASNIHPLIWRLTDLFGTEMAVRLQEAGKSGVIDGFAYDGYWPGATMTTAWWKNVVGLLTEVATIRVATPVRIEVNELAGGRKGLAEYRSQVNFPDPWPGGLWTLRDIVDYELIASRSLLETASRYRGDLLRNMARMALDAVEAGRSGPPYAYALLPDQRDPVRAAQMIDILLENGLEVHRAASSFHAGRASYPAGTFVVRMDQPYRAFAKEILEAQRFPEIRTSPAGEILRPYDVTGWTLPLLTGVGGEWIETPFRAELEGLERAPYPQGTVEGSGRVFLLRRDINAAALAVNRLLDRRAEIQVATATFEAGGGSWPPGTYLISGAARSDLAAVASEARVTFRALEEAPDVATRALQRPRVGLYKPWTASMDEGWTRLILERFGFALESLDNETVREGKLARKLDAIILPDLPKSVLMEGRWTLRDGEPRGYYAPLPPDYQGGLGEEGAEALETFVQEGGTLVALDSAGSLPIERMKLPVRDVLQKVPPEKFRCPGSLLRIRVDPDHPLGYGLPEEVAGYFASSPAYATTIPGAEMDRFVVARYPEHGPLLLSGWIHGERLLRRRAAVVEVRSGKGKVDLLGFRVQHRAQTQGTFRLLFNALEHAAWREAGRSRAAGSAPSGGTAGTHTGFGEAP